MPQLAVITGASAGIGRATSAEIAAAGMQVLAIARRGEALTSLAREFANIEPLAADVTTIEGQHRIQAAVAGRTVTTLVHGAGVFPRGRITSLTSAQWHEAMATNLHARLELTLALRPSLRGGRVLFIGSDAATTPRAGGAAYSVTKAASAMLWRCLVTELGDEIAFAMAKPGLVATDMLEQSLRATREQFPAGEVYEAMQQRGETIAATTVARFFRFLLTEAEREEFAREQGWDIRDASHHPRWLEGPLYLPARDEA